MFVDRFRKLGGQPVQFESRKLAAGSVSGLVISDLDLWTAERLRLELLPAAYLEDLLLLERTLPAPRPPDPRSSEWSAWVAQPPRPPPKCELWLFQDHDLDLQLALAHGFCSQPEYPEADQPLAECLGILRDIYALEPFRIQMLLLGFVYLKFEVPARLKNHAAVFARVFEFQKRYGREEFSAQKLQKDAVAGRGLGICFF